MNQQATQVTLTQVWHLNYDLAIEKGLASKTEHMFPYADAGSSFFKRHVEAVEMLWAAGCYKMVAIVST